MRRRSSRSANHTDGNCTNHLRFDKQFPLRVQRWLEKVHGLRLMFGIPNEANAAFGPQAEPDSVDIQAISLGFQQSGVQTGCGVTYTAGFVIAVAAGTMMWAATPAVVAGGAL